MRQHGYDLTLSIAGAAPSWGERRYPARLKELVIELELEEYVTFEGYVEDAAEWYRHIDIFVSNSYWEGQQVALLEAMASGCYCVCHHWPGAEEIVPDSSLYTTASQMMRCLGEHCDLPEGEKRLRREHMREIAVQRFDLERVKKEIRDIVEQVDHTQSRINQL